MYDYARISTVGYYEPAAGVITPAKGLSIVVFGGLEAPTNPPFAFRREQPQFRTSFRRRLPEASIIKSRFASITTQAPC